MLKLVAAEAAAARDGLAEPVSGDLRYESLRRVELAALDATIRWTEADVLALPTKEYYQERRLKSLGLDTEWDDQEGNAWSGSRGAAW